MKTTERDVQCALYSNKSNSHKIMAPNYTPFGWWECDVWGVTRSGYGVEFEIKLSLADFRNDAKKSTQYWGGEFSLDPTFKHDLLAAGEVKGPSRFFYVVSDAIVEVVQPELPAWAGLMRFDPHPRTGGMIRTVIEAPRLHREKVSAEQREHCGSTLAYRYWPFVIRTNRDKKLEAAS